MTIDSILKDRVYIIAEMSANHAGKIENALEIVRRAAEAGADCVKIQTYTADTITIDCDNDEFMVEGGLWDGYKLYDLYTDAYTPWEWQAQIKAECERCGVDFLSTPFDKTSVDFLESIGIEFYKVASYELVDIPLIEYMANKGKPMIISCGMGSKEEIQEAVDACRRQNNDQIILLKCCSEYPAIKEHMNLALIPRMAEDYGVAVGLSDHSFGYEAPILAVAAGAKVIEKHVCLSKNIENPDADFSMEMQDFAEMVQKIRDAEAIMGSGIYTLTDKEIHGKALRRSLYAVKDIAAGEIFTEENVRSIRPANGLAPKYLPDVLGKRAAVDIKFGTPMAWKLVEGINRTPVTKDNTSALFLRKAQREDIDFLFELANDKVVRNNSFSTSKIEYTNHVKWFEESMNNPARLLYICMLGEIPIGQVRVDINDSKGTVGISIVSEYRSKGYGTRMLELLIEHVVKECTQVTSLIAEIKSDNHPSQHTFSNAGYKEIVRTYEYPLMRNANEHWR